jgi:hypothetical protein
MTRDQAINLLLKHPDTEVRVAAAAIQVDSERRLRSINVIKEAMDALRLDVKYLMFVLEATRRERDELKAGQ